MEIFKAVCHMCIAHNVPNLKTVGDSKSSNCVSISYSKFGLSRHILMSFTNFLFFVMLIIAKYVFY